MNADINNVLYWSATIADNEPNVDGQLAQTANSGFKTVLLWSLHIVGLGDGLGRTPGDLYWNDTPLVTTVAGVSTFDPKKQFTRLHQRLVTLIGPDTDVYSIFFSIGAGGTSDFTAVQQLLASENGTNTLITNFQTLLSNLPTITGFDFDNEDNFDVGTIAKFTALLFTNFSSAITFCPYYDFDFWEACMEKIYSGLGKQPVLWWNLQCYSGGNGNNPVQWAAQLAADQARNGVEDPDNFIIAGYAAMNTQGDGPGLCPSGIKRVFKPFKDRVGGGFIWNSQHIFNNTASCDGQVPVIADYVDAINSALTSQVVRA